MDGIMNMLRNIFFGPDQIRFCLLYAENVIFYMFSMELIRDNNNNDHILYLIIGVICLICSTLQSSLSLIYYVKYYNRYETQQFKTKVYILSNILVDTPYVVLSLFYLYYFGENGVYISYYFIIPIIVISEVYEWCFNNNINCSVHIIVSGVKYGATLLIFATICVIVQSPLETDGFYTNFFVAGIIFGGTISIFSFVYFCFWCYRKRWCYL
eukprot:158808_1